MYLGWIAKPGLVQGRLLLPIVIEPHVFRNWLTPSWLTTAEYLECCRRGNWEPLIVPAVVEHTLNLGGYPGYR